MRSLLLLICITVILPAVRAQKVEPDIVILNANIHTIDDKTPKAEALAVTANRITAVGSTETIRRQIAKNTLVIDAERRLILPGFNDAHVHFTGIGNQFSGMDLRFVRNADEVVEKLKFYARFLPKGRWILGGQWKLENWSTNALPTKELIDPYTPDNPVFLYNKDADLVLVNSAALRISKIDRDSMRNFQGISRNSNGEPTGILSGSAIALVNRSVPKYQTSNWQEVLQTATNYAAAMGVTSVQDMHSDYLGEQLAKLLAEGKLKTRVYDCTPLPEWKKLKDAGIKRASGSGLIRNGCLKSLIDSGEGTAAQLYEEISEADKAGLQVMIHAIGSTPIENILGIFERVTAENGLKDRRFRVEHAYRTDESDIKRFAAAGIIPSLQPHLFRGGDPYRSLLESGASVAFGSDASITDFNPVFGIADAVTAASERERLTIEEAVRLYTLGSAYAEFQEREKGSLEVGKLADLIMLSDDIFDASADKIRETRVLLTIVDGKIVYQEK
ncbi:MAG: amidohydrolase [Pyrinomonadaceae bacterium]